eukprot:TRINITY_DN13413_c0_g1_i1.p1 TRINITY_DN13413_c0_g1~~TRINITY_DN13413_c0_g1_i1.p1  ORF type:complete len:1150 (-),score=231.44 TRINITY_DN13413_c0_g1_i1:206-3193(-)
MTASGDKTNNLMYTSRENDILFNLFSLVTQKGVFEKLLVAFPHERTKEFAELLVTMSISSGVTFKMLKIMIEEEFKSCVTGGNEILRENSVCSKSLSFYFRLVGDGYLQDLLKVFIQGVCSSKSLEIDPTKVTPEVAKQNLLKVTEKVNNIVSIITQSNVPVGIRLICGFVANCAKQWKPDKAHIYIGSVFMLRLLNPVLFSPENYGIPFKISPVARRNLIIIAKFLQNISNGVTVSKKEPYMNSANVSFWQLQLYDWFDHMVLTEFNKEVAHNTTNCVITVGMLHTFHGLVSLKRQVLSEQFEPEDRKIFSSLLDKLGSHENKKNYGHLSESHYRIVKEILYKQYNEREMSYIGYIKDLVYTKKNDHYFPEAILIVTLDRVFIIKEDNKILVNRHFLDLDEITSTRPNEIELTFLFRNLKDEQRVRVSGKSFQTDLIIECIIRSFSSSFCGVNWKNQFVMNVDPPERIDQSLYIQPESQFGGLAATYVSLCNYHRISPIQELAWDLENLYSSDQILNEDDITDFNTFSLTPFLEETGSWNNVAPLIHAVGYNQYIKKLIISGAKITDKSVGLTEMIIVNKSLKSISVTDCIGKLHDFFYEILFNTKLFLTELDISGTVLDEKGAQSLSQLFSKRSTPFVHLNLSGSLSKMDQGQVILALGDAKWIGELKTLKLSKLQLTADTYGVLDKVLRVASGLVELDLSETSINILSIKNGLISLRNLQKLDLSRNLLDKSHFWEYFIYVLGSNPSLSFLDISHTSLPVSVLEKIATFPWDTSLTLISSGNSFGAKGAMRIGEIAAKITCDHLDLSDNGFSDQGLIAILDGLILNPTITTLHINNNFREVNEKIRNLLLEKLWLLLSSTSSSLEALYMRGSLGGRLRDSIVKFLDVLASTSKLSILDISGHAFGDKGALAIRRVLYKNRSLTKLFYEQNGISAVGLRNIAEGLFNNNTIKIMPTPFGDLVNIINDTSNGPSISRLLGKMENKLKDNRNKSQ